MGILTAMKVMRTHVELMVLVITDPAIFSLEWFTVDEVAKAAVTTLESCDGEHSIAVEPVHSR